MPPSPPTNQFYALERHLRPHERRRKSQLHLRAHFDAHFRHLRLVARHRIDDENDDAAEQLESCAAGRLRLKANDGRLDGVKGKREASIRMQTAQRWKQIAKAKQDARIQRARGLHNAAKMRRRRIDARMKKTSAEIKRN